MPSIDSGRSEEVKKFCTFHWNSHSYEPLNSSDSHLNDVIISHSKGQKLFHKIITTSVSGISERRLEIIREISEVLCEQGIVIPKPMPNKDSQLLSFFEDYLLVTYSYLNGVSCKRDPNDVQLAFRTLGIMHRTLREYSLSSEDYFVPKFEDLLLEVESKAREYSGRFSNKIQDVLDSSKEFLQQHGQEIQASSFGIIHGDFAIKHVLRMQDSVGIIDWDLFSFGLLVHDVSRLYDDSIRRGIVPMVTIDEAVTKYNKIVNLNSNDVNIFPFMVQYRLLYRSLNIARKIIEKPSKGLSKFFDKILYYTLEEERETHNLKL